MSLGLDDGDVFIAVGLECSMRFDGVHGRVAMLDEAVLSQVTGRTSSLKKLITCHSLAFNPFSATTTAKLGFHSIEVASRLYI